MPNITTRLTPELYAYVDAYRRSNGCLDLDEALRRIVAEHRAIRQKAARVLKARGLPTKSQIFDPNDGPTIQMKVPRKARKREWR